MISKKGVYSKNCFMWKSTKQIKNYKKRKEKQKHKGKLITKKKRDKEQRECSVFKLMSMRALVVNFGQV